MIKIQLSLFMQSLQLAILTAAAVLNYLNLRDIRNQVDTFMDTMSTRTSYPPEYYMMEHQDFYFMEPKEPTTTPLPPHE